MTAVRVAARYVSCCLPCGAGVKHGGRRAACRATGGGVAGLQSAGSLCWVSTVKSEPLGQGGSNLWLTGGIYLIWPASCPGDYWKWGDMACCRIRVLGPQWTWPSVAAASCHCHLNATRHCHAHLQTCALHPCSVLLPNPRPTLPDAPCPVPRRAPSSTRALALH